MRRHLLDLMRRGTSSSARQRILDWHGRIYTCLIFDAIPRRPSPQACRRRPRRHPRHHSRDPRRPDVTLIQDKLAQPRSRNTDPTRRRQAAWRRRLAPAGRVWNLRAFSVRWHHRNGRSYSTRRSVSSLRPWSKATHRDPRRLRRPRTSVLRASAWPKVLRAAARRPSGPATMGRPRSASAYNDLARRGRVAQLV